MVIPSTAIIKVSKDSVRNFKNFYPWYVYKFLLDEKSFNCDFAITERISNIRYYRANLYHLASENSCYGKEKAFGMAKGAITDSQITSSSGIATKGRLNGITDCWNPGQNDPKNGFKSTSVNQQLLQRLLLKDKEISGWHRIMFHTAVTRKTSKM